MQSHFAIMTHLRTLLLHQMAGATQDFKLVPKIEGATLHR